MEMKKDLGVLVERIDRMREDVKDLTTKVEAASTKIDTINVKLAWIAGICTGITGLVAIVWAVVTQVPWDKLVAAPSPNTQQKVAGAAPKTP